ncbi:discoidin domain-containing protein [Polaribacter ponticola]|uniref:Discoidin domain-containing protein n=1 Tax=Polaribacter ponticola TaxID=2978475 RepID=A0ABT5S7R1_9FLAO|nr:discoidin domain-containing protein [Polaribacter sp. MSW5]MDD7914140.1 discoidin domain-containing protein [Polaribacter sp. MSW5]
MKGTSEVPIIIENDVVVKDAINLLDGNSNTEWSSSSENESELVLNFLKPIEIGGIRLDWAANYAQDLDYFTSLDGKDWAKTSEIKEGLGSFEILKHQKKKLQYVKLVLKNPITKNIGFTIKDITLYGPNKQLSNLVKYEILAQKMPLGLYPTQLKNRQVYWTLLGVPNDTEESLFDEYGNIEPYAGAPTLMPVLKINGKLLTALDAIKIENDLAEGYLPLPSVKWIFKDFDVSINGLSYGKTQKSVSEVSYSLENKTSKKLDATLFFVIHPVQINPKWQHGGLSLIHKLKIDNTHQPKIYVNDKALYILNKKGVKVGATTLNEGTIIQQLYKNRFPSNSSSESEDGLASGAIEYQLSVAPNKNQEIRVGVPLHENITDVNFNKSFKELKDEQIQLWKNKIDKVGFSLGNVEVENTVKSQIGYILLNQDGIVIQPGSRNYNRTWIRDGAMTCSALMRMGLLSEAKDYMEWYAERVRENGQVPPILSNKGENFTGYGADIEYDAQGEFIYGMMEYYRFTKDKKFLKKHFKTIKKAMDYMITLRNVTLEDGYMSKENNSERFRGIIPASISHEGYDIPRHSYWDDFWALRGWLDGEYASNELHEVDIANWANENHKIFASSLKKSIELTVDHFKIDYLPSSADLGDPDPTSIAIALFPCESTSILPEKLLKNTFTSYITSVKDRVSNGKTYSYTPYENRNILALAKLGMRKEAQELHEMMFNDKRPLKWNHWGEVVHSRPRLGSYIGDMPHTWVGSGYVNSVRGLIILENDAEKRIELLNGAPLDWLKNGGISLTDFPTHFGDATIKMKYQDKKLSVLINGKFEDLKEIKLFWPTDSMPKNVLIDGVKVEKYTNDSILLKANTKKIVAFW